MSQKHIKNLKKQGKIKKNIKSHNDDKKLFEVNERLLSYLNGSLLDIPDNWELRHYEKITASMMIIKHTANGIPFKDIEYLMKKNPNGKESSFKPDGGCIAIVKVNDNNELINWYPLVFSESKRQGTKNKPKQAKGNAIERMFKNYNAVVNHVCREDKITPYIVFCQGCDMTNEFIRNKIRQGLSCDINTRNIYTSSTNFRSCPCLMREDDWSETEIFEELHNVVKQSWKYYKEKINEK